jgi:hypothetical protein
MPIISNKGIINRRIAVQASLGKNERSYPKIIKTKRTRGIH